MNASGDPRGPERPGVSVVLALLVSTIGFFALAVFGLGLVSVLTDTDIIAVPGLGQVPGIIGMLVAIGVFAGSVWPVLRRARPGYGASAIVALGTAFAHLLVVGLGATISAGDAVTGLVVAGDLVRGGASVAVLLAAGIAGWVGVALRRTRTQHPRWPWEEE